MFDFNSSFCFNSKNKKALNGIVTISLLLGVTIIAFIFFQTWYDDFSNEFYHKANIKSKQDLGRTNIERFNEGVLYFNNYYNKDFKVDEIKIDDSYCLIGELNLIKGMNEIPLEICLNNTPRGYHNIYLLGEGFLFEKYFFLGEEFLIE